MFETTNKAIADAVAAKRVAGVVAMVQTADGATLYESAQGVRSLETGVPMTLDTVCMIYSMTKAITSVCALQQVEAGKIGFDEPLDKLLPDLAARCWRASTPPASQSFARKRATSRSAAC